ncbi:2-hydroxyacyl-CoA lyase 2 [Manis javanica]|nr:2-hydroxyacyl-CoA lyase 2 [Manis javanica]
MSFGNCGYALPTIIGAKCAAPDRPAIAYAGDGAWGMSMVEIMTAVRHDIPVTAVVFHNRQWGAEKKNQVDFYNRRFVAGELERKASPGLPAPWAPRASWSTRSRTWARRCKRPSTCR